MRRRAFAPCLLAAVLLPSAARAQNPAVEGQWTPVIPVEAIAIHAAVLPTGETLLFGADHGIPGAHGVLVDPLTLAVTEADPPVPWIPDCSGLSFLANGDLFVTGGTESLEPVVGTDLCFAFDAFTRHWVQTDSMSDGRWYATNVTMPDGSTVVMAGTSSIPGVDNQDVAVWSASTPASWSIIGQKLLPLYPFLHVLPSGLIFKCGPDKVTQTYNPATNTWKGVGVTVAPERDQGTSVLLPGQAGRVMLFGGTSTGGSPTASCEIVNFNDATPAWHAAASMSVARRSHNTVLLPDGKVLVVGGRSNGTLPWVAALGGELYDPQAGTFAPLAPLTVPRWYHSTAVLLPDGRVLAAGSDNTASMQVYSPPYLFKGPRPVISSAPLLLKWGASFPLQFTSAQAQNKVVLVALSAVTHANNMSQRHVELGSFSGGGGLKVVSAPASGNLAPPGYYMLFVVDSTGVPSVARMVRVGSQAGGLVRQAGGLAGTHGIPGLDGTGTAAGLAPLTLSLTGALGLAPATLVIGLSQIHLPFKGGTFVPAPDIVIPGLITNAAGAIPLAAALPAGIPAGFQFTLQYWIADPVTPLGVAASNAVVVVTQ